MTRFIAMMLSGALAGNIDVGCLQDTGCIQERYVIEDYFHWVDEQEPIVYRLGRTLGQPTTESNLLNRADCGGMLVGYMMKLDLIKSRWKTSDGESFTYDGGGLNSYRLYTLGKPKRTMERGDFVYMEFEGGQRHIGVACDNRLIYDLYRGTDAKCRYIHAPLMRISSNGFNEFLNREGIILEDTKQIFNYFNTLLNDTGTNLSGEDSTLSNGSGGNSSNDPNWIQRIGLFISNTIFGV